MSRQAKGDEQAGRPRRGRKKVDQAQKAQQEQAVAHAPIEANALLTAVAGCAAGLRACCWCSAGCQCLRQNLASPLPAHGARRRRPSAAAALTALLPFLLNLCSALAGAVARFVVGPLDVLKIRFQVQLEPIAAGVKTSHYTSMRQALVTIVKEEGIKASRGGSMHMFEARKRALVCAVAGSCCWL